MKFCKLLDAAQLILHLTENVTHLLDIKTEIIQTNFIHTNAELKQSRKMA